MLFPPDFLTRLEYLSLTSKRVFRGSLLAQRRTKQMGTGIEFSEHREYSPGDDLRYLDWNIYARHGDLLLKRFQEEQDLHVYVMLDCSGSMAFGVPAKFDLARQLAAAISYIALADLDRVSVLAFADGVLAEFPLTRGKGQILGIMEFLKQLRAGSQQTDLSAGVRGMLQRCQHRGMVIVISDLFDVQGFRRGLDQLRSRHFDVHVIQLHDPQEADPDLRGHVEMIDSEGGSTRTVMVTESARSRYRELFHAHQQEVRHYCLKYALGCTQSPSTVPYDVLITGMMRTASSAGQSIVRGQ